MSSRSKLLYGTLFLSCFLTFQARSQSAQEIKVSGNFENVRILEILHDLEAQTGLNFYFQDRDLPKRQYTIRFDETPIQSALQQLFLHSSTGFSFYRDYAVVFLPQRLIEEVYSADYYEALEVSVTEERTPAEERRIIKVGEISNLGTEGMARVTGTIHDEQTETGVIGATVIWTGLNQATVTDEDGQFESVVPAGEHEILIEYIGYNDFREIIKVESDGELTIEMTKEAVSLDEILIQADAPDASVRDAQISVARLDAQTIKELPSFLGEPDVIKSLLLNPGVSSIGEGATGFNVRGGEVDQNLLMQDEGFFFNSSHALGFFSTFNADLLSDVELYKGIIPAQYGGRLASVMKVDLRSGNFEQFALNGGIGPVTGRLALEGPVVKGKSSILIGGRSSYSDWILDRVDVLEVQRSSSFFYDLNARYTHRFDEKNTIILSGYRSIDDFVYNQEFGFEYNTLMGQFSYRRIFSDNIFSNLSFTYNRYESLQEDFQGLDASILENDIQYVKVKEQISYIPNETFQFITGISGILYQVQPGKQSPLNEFSGIVEDELEKEKGLESAIFGQTEWNLSEDLLLSAGLRLTHYRFLGPKTVYLYEDISEPDETEITGTQFYESGETIAQYTMLEPRVSMRFSVGEAASFKAGYSRTSQFINQIFNSDSPTPTSLWQLSTDYIKPHLSHNYSFGYFKNFSDNNWETSAEVYYRDIDRLYDYKDFADLTVNDHLETELLEGIGRSYGFELSVKRKEGLFNGWLSYTLSRSERKIEEINIGNWYPSNFDKPNDFSLVLNYSPNQQHTVTVNFNYGKGRPTTPPVGNFKSGNGLVVPVYTERNQLRVPDYHRLDVAYTIGKGYRKNVRFKTSWTFSIYNVYGRKNAFSVFFTQGAFQQAQANKLSVLGSAFPAITFNFQFI